MVPYAAAFKGDNAAFSVVQSLGIVRETDFLFQNQEGARLQISEQFLRVTAWP